MNRYILGAVVLGATGFILAFSINTIIQLNTSPTSAQLPTQESSESIEPPNSDLPEASPTLIAPVIPRITVHTESKDDELIYNTQPTVQVPEDYSSTNNRILLSNKLSYPFEMFTLGGGIIFIAIVLMAICLIFVIQENIVRLRGTDFLIDREALKKIFIVLSSWLLFMSAIIFIENAQSNYYNLEQQEESSAATSFSSFMDFILQDSEGLPEPFNNSRTLMRVVLYVVLLSVATSFSILVFGSAIKSLTSNYYELMGEELKNDDERRLERFYAISMGQTVKSFWLSFILISAGFVVILFAIGLAVATPEPNVGIAIVGGISGVLLEFIGGTALLLYSRNAQYFKHFFDSLIRRYEIEQAVDIHNNLTGHPKETAKIIVTHLTSKNDLNHESRDDSDKK